MKQIKVRQAAGIFSQRELDTHRILNGLPRNLWAVECKNSGGIPHEVVVECDRNSQGWTGWTFVPAGQATWPRLDAIPVLLFEHQEDAFWAEFRHGSGGRLNRLEDHEL